MNSIRIHNDLWDDLDKVYQVISWQTTPDSTGVKLTLQHGDISSERVVAIHQIEWIEEPE